MSSSRFPIGCCEKILIEGENKGEKGGNLPLPQFSTDFNNFQEKFQVAGSSQVVVKKIVIEWEIGGKGGSLP